MSVEYAILCDGCENVVDGSSISAAAARRLVRREGGRVNLPGGKDLCGLCVQAGKKPAKTDR